MGRIISGPREWSPSHRETGALRFFAPRHPAGKISRAVADDPHDTIAAAGPGLIKNEQEPSAGTVVFWLAGTVQYPLSHDRELDRQRAWRSAKVKQPTGGNLPLIGWREWVGLPGLGISAVKAKVDTGARSSALHAFDLEPFRRGGQQFIRFKVHPLQRNLTVAVQAEAEVLEYRHVRSSGGHVTWRPVILTSIELLGQRWLVELTLASRDTMGFRMLLGRQAIRGRFAVDAGRSFLATRRV